MMSSLPGNAWLFVRGNFSVRIIRGDRSLLILGPGSQRQVHTADDATAVVWEQRRIEAGLRRDGWIFEGCGVERRQSPDRRRVPRWAERRRVDERP